MKWFRFYHDAIDDPKVQKLEPWLFKIWINLLCLASKNDDRGTLPPISEIAFALRLSEAEASRAIDNLTVRGLIDVSEGRMSPHNWAGRQRPSDDVAARVRKHRRAQPEDETLRVTLHETGLKRSREDKRRQDEIRRDKIPPLNPPEGEDPKAAQPDQCDFDDWYDRYPIHRDRARAIKAWKKLSAQDRVAARSGLGKWLAAGEFDRRLEAEPGKDYRPYPASWLNGRRWEDELETEPSGLNTSMYQKIMRDRMVAQRGNQRAMDRGKEVIAEERSRESRL